jgi:hypothetical protein
MRDGYSAGLLGAVITELTAPIQVQSIDQDLLKGDDHLAVYGANTGRLLALEFVPAQVRLDNKLLCVLTSGLTFARFLESISEVDDDSLRLLSPLNSASGEERYLREEISSGEFGRVDMHIMRWLRASGAQIVSISLSALDVYAGKVSEVSGIYVEAVTSATIECILEVAATGVGEYLPSTNLMSTLVDALVESEDFTAAAELIVLIVATWPHSVEASSESALKKTTIAKFLAMPSGTPELFAALKETIDRFEMATWLFDRASAITELAPFFIEYFKPLSAVAKIVAEVPVRQIIPSIDVILSSVPSRANELIDLVIGLHCGASEIDEFLGHLLASREKWRWLSRAALVATDAAARDAVGSVIEVELDRVTAQEWSSGASQLSWRERAAIELHALRPNYKLNKFGDLVRRLLTTWAIPSAPAQWTSALAIPFVEMLRSGVQLQIGREEAGRIVERTPSGANEYWAVATPVLDRWMSHPTSHGHLPSFVNAIVEGGDGHAVRWLVAAISANGQLRKLIGDDAFRGEVHRRVREKMAADDSADEVDAALTLLKKEIANCARYKGRRGIKKR